MSLLVALLSGGVGAESPEQPPRVTSVRAGFYHTCALVDTGKVKCWCVISGRGWRRSTMQAPEPVSPPRSRPPPQLTRSPAGRPHPPRRLPKVSSAPPPRRGHNANGELGLGDTTHRGNVPGQMGDALPYVDLGSDVTVKAIVPGGYHTCAILSDDRLKCWGLNKDGELGLGDVASRGVLPGQMGDTLPYVELGTGRTVRHVSAGGWHTCAVLDTGDLKCWGYNTWGQLGYGDKLPRGDAAASMGDSLPPVDLGPDETDPKGEAKLKAASVSGSGWHTCALLTDGGVKCWGIGQGGRLGYGDDVSRGMLPTDMGSKLPRIDLGAGLKAVEVHGALGGWSTCAALSDKSVKCWGDNTAGQLGLQDQKSRGDQADEMGDSLPAVDLGAGALVARLSVSDTEACALLETKQVKCWGINETGQLGQGDLLNRGGAPNSMGDKLPPVDLGDRLVEDVAASDWHTCVLTTGGEVVCWGLGNFGQVGMGDALVHGTFLDAAGKVSSQMGGDYPSINIVGDTGKVDVTPGSEPNIEPTEVTEETGIEKSNAIPQSERVAIGVAVPLVCIAAAIGLALVVRRRRIAKRKREMAKEAPVMELPVSTWANSSGGDPVGSPSAPPAEYAAPYVASDPRNPSAPPTPFAAVPPGQGTAPFVGQALPVRAPSARVNMIGEEERANLDFDLDDIIVGGMASVPEDGAYQDPDGVEGPPSAAPATETTAGQSGKLHMRAQAVVKVREHLDRNLDAVGRADACDPGWDAQGPSAAHGGGGASDCLPSRASSDTTRNQGGRAPADFDA